MVLWLSKSPANVRDGRSVLQKTCQCEGWQKRSPKDLPMWGMAEAFSRRQRMWGTSWYFTYTYAHDSYHWLLLLQAILYYSTSLLIIYYCHTKLYTINHDNCFDTQRPTTPSGQQSLPQAIYYDNTRRDQIGIRNSPRHYTIAQTLRQKQYFENLQKYLGRLEKDSISKNHNDHFRMQQREITHRGA